MHVVNKSHYVDQNLFAWELGIEPGMWSLKKLNEALIN